MNVSSCFILKVGKDRIATYFQVPDDDSSEPLLLYVVEFSHDLKDDIFFFVFGFLRDFVQDFVDILDGFR